MNISKKNRSKAEKKYSRLVGKTKDEINKFLYNNGFKKGDELHIKKSSFFSTIKLEIYYVDNVALMITIYQSFLFFFTKESSLIRPV